MLSEYILIRSFLKDICCLLIVFFTSCNVVSTVAPPGSSMNCYVCNSGLQSNPNRNCPPSGITAPYLIHNEACYGRCFIKTNIRNPSVIYRGCTDAFPGLPASLPVDKCHTYADEIWCLCVLNMCNRGSLDDLRNPPKEEEEEDVGRGGRIEGGTRGRQRPPHQVAQGGNTHKSDKNQNLPLQPDRGRWATPSSNQVRVQWHLKRIPPELTNGKSPEGGAEAYLDVRVANASSNMTMAEDSREQTNETIQNSGSRTSSTNHLYCCQHLNVLHFVILGFLLALISA